MSACHEDHCVTCGDVADEMRVVAIDRERELALCRGPDGERRTVEIALVGPVAPGDGLLVHAGTAIGRLDAEAGGRGAEEAAAHPVAPGRGAEEAAAHPVAPGRGAEEATGR